MKSWLIRTSNNFIFGPLSKTKVIELYQNGSIQPNDEICSGNGFWFYVKEEKLVEKYLLGKAVQNFNPVSEALDVLSAPEIKLIPEEEKSLLSKVDHTEVINISDIDNSDIDDDPLVDLDDNQESEQVEVSHGDDSEIDLDLIDKKKSNTFLIKKSFLNNKILMVLFYLAIVLFLYLIYYRKTILNNIISKLNPISNVYAQADLNSKKKSYF